MKELIASEDPVFLSMIKYGLDEEGIGYHVFDSFMGGLFPGIIGLATHRVMVAEEDFYRASLVLSGVQAVQRDGI